MRPKLKSGLADVSEEAEVLCGSHSLWVALLLCLRDLLQYSDFVSILHL